MYRVVDFFWDIYFMCTHGCSIEKHWETKFTIEYSLWGNQWGFPKLLFFSDFIPLIYVQVVIYLIVGHHISILLRVFWAIILPFTINKLKVTSLKKYELAIIYANGYLGFIPKKDKYEAIIHTECMYPEQL